MRCLAAIDNLKSDVIFIDCDSQFTTFLENKTKDLYGDDYEANNDGEPNLHVASHYFQYFSTIQDKQISSDNALSSIVCKDGLVAAFHRFDTIDVISIENDVSLKDVAITRCVVFEKLAKLHFGPATSFLKPTDPELRYRLWSKLRSYLSDWDDVTGFSSKYQDSDDDTFSSIFDEYFKQHFLFQSVEELHVNSMLKKQSMQLMYKALDSAQRIDRAYCQAILAVNGKVLFYHSTRHHKPLVSSDLLFILFIAHSSLPKSTINIDELNDSSTDNRETKYYQQTIFIKMNGHSDHYLPCSLTAVSIEPGIVFILLSEVNTAIAPNICQAIQSLLVLEKQIEAVEDLHNRKDVLKTSELYKDFLQVKGVIDFYLARMKRDMNRLTHLQDAWLRIQTDWRHTVNGASVLGGEANKFYQFSKFVSGFILSLRHLFYAIYCRDGEKEIQEDVLNIYRDVKTGLRDSASYLIVKSQRNFTLGNYLSEFPGIVHFLLINRTKNRIIVPNLSGGDGKSIHFCYEIIQTLYRFHKRMVFAGYNTGHMRKKDLLYSYRLWFQKVNSNLSIKPDNMEPYVPKDPEKQLLCMFYNNLVMHHFVPRHSHQMECYELLTIYIGDLPLGYVMESNKRLVESVISDMLK